MEGDSLDGDAVDLAVWQGARSRRLLQLDPLANYFPGTAFPGTTFPGTTSPTGKLFSR